MHCKIIGMFLYNKQDRASYACAALLKVGWKVVLSEYNLVNQRTISKCFNLLSSSFEQERAFSLCTLFTTWSGSVWFMFFMGFLAKRLLEVVVSFNEFVNREELVLNTECIVRLLRVPCTGGLSINNCDVTLRIYIACELHPTIWCMCIQVNLLSCGKHTSCFNNTDMIFALAWLTN